MKQSETIQTTCAYCGVGCGLEVKYRWGYPQVSADKSHPANLGLICQKGGTLGQTMDHKERFLFPSIGGKTVNWQVAINHVANTFNRVIAQHGPNSVAFYVSGQMLTEDYYVANKLMKGYIGSANIDTNSRLCMASTVVGNKKAFGEDLVPACYEDLDEATLVVVVGSNMADCHPVLFKRLQEAKKRNQTRVVVIDPRKTNTTTLADHHLQIAGGSDVALFNGLLKFFKDQSQLDFNFIESHVSGFSASLEAVEHYTIPRVAEICKISEIEIHDFYRLVLKHPKTITVFSQGVNQSSQGTNKVSSIINFHLATGRIGKPGSAPFSFTGQNNAMGGREVGGLANQLAVHLDIDNEHHRQTVQRYWNSPKICEHQGLKAIDLFRACSEGKVKALWIMATNPVVSLPSSSTIVKALKACETVIVSEAFQSSATTDYADVILPASTWGEKDGMVTNTERCISRQRSFTSPPGDSRSDWWIICQVARAMGFQKAFDYKHPREIFNEYAGLTAYENQDDRCLDLGRLANLSQEDYETFEPMQWPWDSRGISKKRLFEDGSFFHPDKRARMIPVRYKPSQQIKDPDQLLLTTGRIKDQWHTMTRTARVPSLNQGSDEPIVSIHPNDLIRYGITPETQLVRITSSEGQYIGKFRLDLDIKPGHVFIPFHWHKSFGSRSRANNLTAGHCDPFSGQPEYKLTPVELRPFRVESHGYIATRRDLRNLKEIAYLMNIPLGDFSRYELGFDSSLENVVPHLSDLLMADDEDWIDYLDPKGNHYKAVCFSEGKIESIINLSSSELSPKGRERVAEMFQKKRVSLQDRVDVFSL